MANVTETPSYDAGIYQIETTDPVLGGPNGTANAQAKGLANRTAFLKQQIDQLNSGQLTPAWIASQDYVQEQLQKLDAKQSVRAATTANITLSGVQTIDGVVLTVGDRVLVKNQTAAAQNGIYLAAAQGWVRAPDADNGTKLSSGARVSVEDGTVNAGKVWRLSNAGTIIIGTSLLLFIDDNANSTETSPGIIKVSTQQQTDAGVADDVAVTPKKIRLGFSFSIGNSGYIIFPSWLGSFKIIWGEAVIKVGTVSSTVVMPMSFDRSFFSVIATHETSSPQNGGIFSAARVGLTGVSVYMQTPTGVNESVMYMAIGV